MSIVVAHAFTRKIVNLVRKRDKCLCCSYQRPSCPCHVARAVGEMVQNFNRMSVAIEFNLERGNRHCTSLKTNPLQQQHVCRRKQQHPSDATINLFYHQQYAAYHSKVGSSHGLSICLSSVYFPGPSTPPLPTARRLTPWSILPYITNKIWSTFSTNLKRGGLSGAFHL